MATRYPLDQIRLEEKMGAMVRRALKQYGEALSLNTKPVVTTPQSRPSDFESVLSDFSTVILDLDEAARVVINQHSPSLSSRDR